MKERASPQKDELDDHTFTANGQKASGRSITQIFQDVVNHVSEIIRSEIRLAKTEVAEDIRKATNVAVYFAAGAALAFYALGFLLLGAVYALGTTLSPWLAAVLVGAVTGIIAICLLLVGRAKVKKENFRPDKTIQSLEDNVTWMKKQTR